MKVGTLGWWHAVHIVLSVATGGLWLVVYAVHAIVAAVNRTTVTVNVPEGGRIEYYRGHPQVLMPDEYLQPDTRREMARNLMIGGSIGLIIVMAVAGFLTLR